MAEFWSLNPRDEWWFRGADFPRLQILALGLFSFFAMLFAIPKWTLTTELLFVGLVAAIAYQLKMVLPYTPIWRKQVQKLSLSKSMKTSKSHCWLPMC
jgi:hypothetical protein